MFSIGDKVKIIDDGATYSAYEELARRLRAKRWRIVGRHHATGECGVITNIGRHSGNRTEFVALVDMGDEEILIGTRGIILTKKSMAKPKKVNFLLKYDLIEDPIEEFETMKQVEDRIKELLEMEDYLDKETIMIYEVKSVKRAKIKTVIEYQ